MSNAPKNASEETFQQNFVETLKKYKWQAPDDLDGNKQKITVDDLVNHWRNELNRLNADQLEGVPLTDDEFKQVMSKVSQISNSYEAAKVLAIEESKGKIDGIYRDDNPNVTRKTITLTIFKKAQVSGGDSSYKVAREVSTANGNRFDIVLLINGLPLINIEQKRTDKSLDEAFGQFQRYYREGEYTNNFMAFSQMMVVNSEIETRYFATPKSANDFNPAFVFSWSDKVNKRINDWEKVIKHFLMIPMAHQMVGDYLVIDEDPENEENRRHMLMRPYQVYALQAVEGAAFGFDNDERTPHGGFVWHTTGSGKTITSFKTAQFLSTRAGFDKVVFLVDRRDLDKQTTKNFKAYAHYESVIVDETKSTNKLRAQLKSQKSGIVVTTTFKLSSLVKELEEGHDTSFADKKIVFIIDEAHRTTMGQMMGDIRKYFKTNGLFFGFTGTPLFDENNVKGKVNEKSELINTTEKLFGPLLHQYTIDQAIADGNVLGFNVDYVNTGEFKGYDDLREQLIEAMKLKSPDKAEKDIERTVQALSDLEVEKSAVKENILVYQDESHIPRVVSEILEGWQKQSQGGEFNSILTVAYKPRVIAYYHEFKKQIVEKFTDGIKPNIAMTFSFGNENEPDNVSKEVAKEMFADYADFTGIEFIAGDSKRGEDAYFEDLTERATRGGSGRNPKNIDFVIVAEQLLTGYDSKRLNTLYVDRTLELQKLIQSYSRTNRVFGSNKEFGTIINFQYPEMTKEMVNAALELYGSGGSSSPAIVDLYETAVKKLKIELDSLIAVLNDPTTWADIKDDDDAKKEFKEAFLEALAQLNLVQQYYEYKWHDESFGMDEHTWLQYVGAYKNLFPRTPGDDEPVEIRPLAGKTKLQATQVIDASYILKLIGEKVVSSDGKHTVDDETLRLIYQEIQELSDMGENEKAKSLREFVDSELLSGNLSSSIGFDAQFKQWMSDRIVTAVDSFAEEWGIDKNLLKRSFDAYSTSKADEVPYFDEITRSVDFAIAKNQLAGNKLRHNVNLRQELKKWMPEVKQRFN